MRQIKKQQSGFTLIELVVVIVILGILAVTALPKFVDLSDDAYAAAAQGYAGALNSANSINYAGCAAKGGVATDGVCVKVAKCSDVFGLITPTVTYDDGALPDPTVKGTLYLAEDTVSTAEGVSCAATYGDGGAGTAFTFTATTT